MKIILNVKEIDWHKDTISYEDVLELLGEKPSRALTITHYAKRVIDGERYERNGQLYKGKSISVLEGMIINCADTSNA